MQKWKQPPLNLSLSKDEVHVWLADLDQAKSYLPQLALMLSDDEQLRAERFYLEKHRQRFTIGRGILRIILGRYLKVEPQALKFRYQAFGKPELVQPPTVSKLWFNLSHSEQLAVYAVACDRSIGVDLEYLRSIADLEQLAQRFFSTREYAAIQALPDHQKHKAFFRYWTCKEAYLKATGEGIAKLGQVEIQLAQQASFIAATNLPQSEQSWNLKEFVPAPDYVAAIAFTGQNCQIQYWQFEI